MMGVEECEMIVPDEIQKEIKILLFDRFGLTEDIMLQNEDGNFFGERGLLNPRELTYLAYMLEQRYNIQFSMREYNDQRFYNLSGLSTMIAEMASRKIHCEMADG